MDAGTQLEQFDYDYPSNRPVFVSESASFSVKEGDSIVLPCQTSDLGPYPVVWRKGNRVISAGPTITAIERRFRLVQGHSLQIDRVRVRDAGTFVCSVSTDPVTELTHQLDVMYGPTVQTIPESGMVVAQKGSEETLECSARGKPQPQVVWRKQTGLLPTGEKTRLGNRYTVSQISRQMAGVYECVADNGLGQTAVGRISLQVQYPPEVEVERSTVYTGEGYAVKLACFVYADPPAKVVWARDGSPLDAARHVPSDDVAMGTRHTLTDPPRAPGRLHHLLLPGVQQPRRHETAHDRHRGGRPSAGDERSGRIGTRRVRPLLARRELLSHQRVQGRLPEEQVQRLFDHALGLEGGDRADHGHGADQRGAVPPADRTAAPAARCRIRPLHPGAQRPRLERRL
ncbi:lachesin-like [Pollicipes pollicipes]|uniref:lachesin-like n=1 Tax=Pollicipes pollicipes TaxID=41117 RepID=UPI001884B089|nr:lachesin-like [Pollicipes pollicipes]